MTGYQPAAAESLAEEVTERLGKKTELRLFLKSEFQQGIDRAGAGAEEITIARQKVRGARERESRKPTWLSGPKVVWTFWGAMVLAWLIAAGATANRWLLPGSGHGVPSFLKEVRKERFEAFQKRDSAIALMSGDVAESRALIERMKARSPEDPAIYRMWVYDRIASNEQLPEDYDTTWQRIDPGNGDWLLLKAIHLSRKAMTKVGSKWSVTDLAAFQEMTEVIEEAQRQPRRDDYRKRYVRLLIDSFRQPRNLEEARTVLDCFEGRPVFRSGLPLSAYRIRLEKLAAAGDREEMLRLGGEIRRILANEVRDGYLDYLGRSLGKSLHDAGLTEEAERIYKLDAIQSVANQRGYDRYWSKKSPLFRANDLYDYRHYLLAASGGVIVLAGLLALRLVPPGGAGNQGALCALPLLGRWARVKIALAGLVLPLAGAGIVWLLLKEDSQLLDLDEKGWWYLGGWGVIAATFMGAACAREMDRGIGIVGLGLPRWQQMFWRILPVFAALCPPLLLWTESSETGLTYGGPWLALTMGFIVVSLTIWGFVGVVRGFLPGPGSIRSRISVRLLLPSLGLLTAVLLAPVPVLMQMEEMALAGPPERYRFSPDDHRTFQERQPRLNEAEQAQLQKLTEQWDREDGL